MCDLLKAVLVDQVGPDRPRVAVEEDDAGDGEDVEEDEEEGEDERHRLVDREWEREVKRKEIICALHYPIVG